MQPGQGQPQAGGAPAPRPAAGPTAGPGQAGPTPGQNLRPAPAAARDDLLRRMGEAYLAVGREWAEKGMQADPTALARGFHMMKEVDRVMRGPEQPGAVPLRGAGMLGQSGARRQIDRPVDTLTGAPPNMAGAGDRPAAAPVHPTR